MRKALDKTMDIIGKYGLKACLIERVISGARAFVSLVSGIFKVSFKDFIIYSSLGIIMWDFGFVFIGYFIANLS